MAPWTVSCHYCRTATNFHLSVHKNASAVTFNANIRWAKTWMHQSPPTSSDKQSLYECSSSSNGDMTSLFREGLHLASVDPAQILGSQKTLASVFSGYKLYNRSAR